MGTTLNIKSLNDIRLFKKWAENNNVLFQYDTFDCTDGNVNFYIYIERELTSSMTVELKLLLNYVSFSVVL